MMQPVSSRCSEQASIPSQNRRLYRLKFAPVQMLGLDLPGYGVVRNGGLLWDACCFRLRQACSV